MNGGLYLVCRYSGASYKGPSDKRTTSLLRTLEKENLSTRGKGHVPKVSSSQRFHCIYVVLSAYHIAIIIAVDISVGMKSQFIHKKAIDCGAV